MAFRDDERAQSVVIGSLLIFAILIISFSSYQAVVVPQENRGVEIDHSEVVRQSMQDVRSAVIRASGGVEQSVSVPIGTRYPNRALFINPAPPSGTLETEAPNTITVRNAAATGETGDYWNGSDRTYESRPLHYRPSYNEYRDPPVSEIEYTVLTNDYDEAVVPASGQDLVDGRRIGVVMVAGDYQRSGSGTASVDLKPASPSTKSVPIDDDGGPIEVAIRTRIPESVWVDLLTDEIDGADGSETTCAAVGTPRDDHPERFIDDCQYDDTADPAALALTLESGETYRLRAAKVGVGSGVEGPSSTYVVAAEGDGATIPDGGEQRVVAQVRDEYDNPVAGVEACAQVTDGPMRGSLSSFPARGETDADGEVAFTFEADDGADGDATVTVGFDCTGATPDTSLAARAARFDITVYDTGGGGGSSSLRAASAEDLGSGDTQQDLTFTLDRDLVVGESVTVDLSDPQGPNRVDYGSASVTADTTGTATFTTQSEQNAVITYTVSGVEGEGDTVTLAVDGLDASGAQSTGTYDVVFEGPDGDTVTASFEVS
jgi:hypothetical protein